MDTRFEVHNRHRSSPERFVKEDPHLRTLFDRPYRYRSELLNQFPQDTAGVYSLTGARQVGKTSLLKLWIKELLERGTAKERIAFFTGELIDDQHALVHLLSEEIQTLSTHETAYLIIDEVSYIRDWDKGVKFLADAGILRQVVLMLSGSDASLIREARMRFPGRRGRADTVDFHLYPLSFREFLKLKNLLPEPKETESGTLSTVDDKTAHYLLKEFQNYLLHGGFLTAINEFAATSRISKATLRTYSDWLRGDVLRRGKQEHYLREILAAIAARYGSQLTWNTLAQTLSIDHPKTVSDYITLLEDLDAVFVQAALLENKLGPAPKKARKVMYTDPFIFHAVRDWLQPSADPFAEMQGLLLDPEQTSRLVEATVVTHYRRHHPTYYIKAEGEVDIAVVHKNRFHPIEVKWTKQMHTKDIKQIQKYPNGKILTRHNTTSLFDTNAEFLPLALLRL